MSDELPDNLKALLDAAKLAADVKDQTEFFTFVARIQKIKFDTLIEVGFNEDQALKLCALSLMPEIKPPRKE